LSGEKILSIINEESFPGEDKKYRLSPTTGTSVYLYEILTASGNRYTGKIVFAEP
jgi:hypothetical protein